MLHGTLVKYSRGDQGQSIHMCLMVHILLQSSLHFSDTVTITSIQHTLRQNLILS